MVRRLNNLTKWRVLEPGKLLKLGEKADPENARKIRVEFNTSRPASVFAVIGKERYFVAVIDGYEEVWFSAPGEVHLEVTSNGVVTYFTPESESTAIDLQQQSFTVLSGGRVRDPVYDMIEARMRLNELRNRQLWESEFERMRGEIARLQGADAQTGEIVDDPSDPADPAADSETGGAVDPVLDEGGGVDPAQQGGAGPAAKAAKPPKGSKANAGA